MPRIRSLHPGQWTAADFCKLQPEARLLCLGLRNIADDHGVFEWDPSEIKITLMPLDNVDIPVLLQYLSRTGHVKKFSHKRRQYGQIRNFLTYQRPQKPKYVHPWPKIATGSSTDISATPHALRSRPRFRACGQICWSSGKRSAYP